MPPVRNDCRGMPSGGTAEGGDAQKIEEHRHGLLPPTSHHSEATRR